MPNELFWDSTQQEVMAVLKARQRYERQANLRAGLVAATIINVHRKRGTRLVRPGDFLKVPRTAAQYMSLEEGQKHMGRWAKKVNAHIAGDTTLSPQREDT